MDQAATSIGKFPIRDIIQQEMKCSMRLPEGMLRKRSYIFCNVNHAPAKVICEWFHELIKDGFWKHPKDHGRQNLVLQFHRLLRVWVFAFMQVSRSMDLSAPERGTAGKSFQPTNDVIIVRSAIMQGGKVSVEILHGQCIHN